MPQYADAAFHSLMDTKDQRIQDIKASLHDMTLEEMQQMSDDLSDLIQVLVTRQIAIEGAIYDRLEATFSQ